MNQGQMYRRAGLAVKAVTPLAWSEEQASGAGWQREAESVNCVWILGCGWGPSPAARVMSLCSTHASHPCSFLSKGP